MKHPEIQAFLNEGYTQFPRVYSAVTTFTNLVYDRLERCIDAAQFRGMKTNPERRRTKKSGGSADEGMWIYVSPNYNRGKAKVLLEVGLWWDCPDLAAPMIAYLGGLLNKTRFPAAGYKPKEKRLRFESLNGTPYLYAPLNEGQDPFEAIERLLAEVEPAIGALG
jgi:hypothetical protein